MEVNFYPLVKMEQNLYLKFNIQIVLTGTIGDVLNVQKVILESYIMDQEDGMDLNMHKDGALMFLLIPCLNHLKMETLEEMLLF